MLPSLPPMTDAVKQLEGQTVLSGIKLDEIVIADDAIATFRATRLEDGSQCTVRVSRTLAVMGHQETWLLATFTRIARHTVGIRTLSRPIAAGIVTVDGVQRLSLAHAGVPSSNAEERIQAGCAASVDEVLVLLEPIAQALGVLHDQGIAHGAVCPSAVQIEQGTVTLSAFGLSALALAVGGSCGAREVVPRRSRAPEQGGEAPASPSPETDTYALARLTLELLAGRPCLVSSDLDSQAAVEAIDPTSFVGSLPEEVAQVFSEALRPEPQNRCSDPRLFLRKLSDARNALGSIQPSAAPMAIEQPSGAVQESREGSDSKEQSANAGPSEDAVPNAPQKKAPNVFESEPRKKQPIVRPSQFYAPQSRKTAKTQSHTRLFYLALVIPSLLLIGCLLAGAVFIFYRSQKPGSVAVVTSPTSPVPAEASELFVAPDASMPTVPNYDPDEWESSGGKNRPIPSELLPDPKLAAYASEASALIPVVPETVMLGTRNALVTLVLFADVTCPHTGRAVGVIRQLAERYHVRLRVSVRYLPIARPRSLEAAEIVAATFDLYGAEKYWEVFERMTKIEEDPTFDDLIAVASELGVDAKKLRAALKSDKYRARVKRDEGLAAQLMVRATPTFFVNGIHITGINSPPTLAEAVEDEHTASIIAIAGSGLPAGEEDLYKERVLFNVTSAAADND